MKRLIERRCWLKNITFSSNETIVSVPQFSTLSKTLILCIKYSGLYN